MPDHRKGILYSILAYTLWGIFPLYWKALHSVPAFQVLLHRTVWGALFLAAVLLFQKRLVSVIHQIASPRILGMALISGFFLLVNWLIYVWAIPAGYVLESSLGYFIAPLLNILFGVLVFKERLRVLQIISVVFALIGVLNLVIFYGKTPWIALSLGFSFAIYGLLRKRSPLHSVEGLFAETGLLSLPAAALLLNFQLGGTGAFLSQGSWIDTLLVMTGPITAAPLLLFASGARRIPLSLVGMFQYISPTIQFLLGILVFKEKLTSYHLFTFACIWCGVVLFLISLYRQAREKAE